MVEPRKTIQVTRKTDTEPSQQVVFNDQNNQVKRIRSSENRDNFYLLQKQLGEGRDGKVWLAKRKQETAQLTGKRLGEEAKSYFCIKQF